MEVQKEAQRIMTLSVWKMYHSRMQRGGLRLHRSLQLSLVMRSARELYLSAKVEPHQPEFPPPGRTLDPRLHPPREAEAAVRAAPADAEQPPEPMDTQEEALRVQETPALCDPSPARVSRKRRSSSDLSDGGDVGLVPSKKARLEEEVEREETSEVADRLQLPPAQTEGAFPNLARVLQRRFSSLLNCGPAVPPPAPPRARPSQPAARPTTCSACSCEPWSPSEVSERRHRSRKRTPEARAGWGKPAAREEPRPELPEARGKDRGAGGAGAFSQTCVRKAAMVEPAFC